MRSHLHKEIIRKILIEIYFFATLDVLDILF